MLFSQSHVSFAVNAAFFCLKLRGYCRNEKAKIDAMPFHRPLICFSNGELKEYIAAGVSKDEFFRRIRAVLGLYAPTQSPQTQGASSTSTNSTSNETPVDASLVYPARDPTPGSSQSLESSIPASEPRSSRAVQDLLAERAARLEIQKKEQEAKERAKRAAEARSRKEAEEAAIPASSKASADKKYALMQKKRQQDAKEERARILKRVEDDKAERRHREAQRKEEAKAKLESQTLPTGASSFKQPPSSNSAQCALQIRLFDGSTIRSHFSSSGTLKKDIKPWIDEKQPGDVPYTFKHVLTPLPNKNIEAAEEERSLLSLGLTPSATLILVPVAEYTSAYTGGGTSLLWGGVSAGYGLVSSGVGMVAGTLGSILGGGGAARREHDEMASIANNQNPSINVRTLGDQRQDDQQFYNGNAVSDQFLISGNC